MNSRLLMVVLLCAICAGPVTCISRWFSATFNDLKFTMYRYGYCVNGLLPLNSTRVNETDYLVNQIKSFLDQGNYDNEQLANVSALMDNICRSSVDLSYPISVNIDINKFQNTNPRGKENRCRAIDDAMDSMYWVFKRAALNRSEPLDFSTVQYYANETERTSSYNLSDLINTSWITSETVLESVCAITNATKDYVAARSSNSTAQARQQVPAGYVSSFLEFIDRAIEPLLGLQKRLYWEGTTRLELLSKGVSSSLGSLRRGVGKGFERISSGGRSRANSTLATNSSSSTSPRPTSSSTNSTSRRLNGTTGAVSSAPVSGRVGPTQVGTTVAVVLTNESYVSGGTSTTTAPTVRVN